MELNEGTTRVPTIVQDVAQLVDDDDCIEEVEVITAKVLAICRAKTWFIFYSFTTLIKHPGSLWRAICSCTSSSLSLPISGTKSLLVSLPSYVAIGLSHLLNIISTNVIPSTMPLLTLKKWETRCQNSWFTVSVTHQLNCGQSCLKNTSGTVLCLHEQQH